MSYLFIAIFLLLAGHAIRAVRWAMLFPRDSISRPSTLLVGLSLSYLLNLFIPYRLSEIARIVYVSDRQKIRLAPVISSVLLERLSDCVVLIAVGLPLVYFALGDYVLPLSLLLSIPILLLALAFLINKSQRSRTALWKLTALFNENIRIACIEIAWTFTESVKGGVLFKRKFLLLTFIMWVTYCLSYYFISKAIAGYSLLEVTKLIFESPHFFSSLDAITRDGSIELLLYIVTPLIISITYAILSDRSGFIRTIGHLIRGKGAFTGVNMVAVPENFKDYQNYSIFLKSLFQGKNSIVSLFGMKAIDDGIVNRIFHGGSGALIAQVQVQDTIFIRKFAIDSAGRKLAGQASWMKDRSSALPMVSIVNERLDDSWFYYDMPFSAGARDFYEIIHASHVEKSKLILEDIVNTLMAFHQNTAKPKATDEIVTRYFVEKVENNINVIFDKVDALIDLPDFYINGKKFNIDQWNFLKDKSFFLDTFRDRNTCDIHGDLTIENVIIDASVPHGWFLIDPNPENIFNTPMIDWAKLFQSLHMGYEIINKGINCKVQNNDIQFFAPRTIAYQTLYEHLCNRLRTDHGEDFLRQVYLHEIINYLRLTPYKFNYGPEQGILFFAHTCILIDEFRQRYDIP